MCLCLVQDKLTLLMFPVGYLPYQVVVAGGPVNTPCEDGCSLFLVLRYSVLLYEAAQNLLSYSLSMLKVLDIFREFSDQFVGTMPQKQNLVSFQEKMSSDNYVKMYTAEWTIITPGNLITGTKDCIVSQNYTLAVVINWAKYFLKFLYLNHFHLQYSEEIL